MPIFRVDSRGGNDKYINTDKFALFRWNSQNNELFLCDEKGVPQIFLQGDEAIALHEYLDNLHISSVANA